MNIKNRADRKSFVEQEILGDHPEIRTKYIGHFDKQLSIFIELSRNALDEWDKFNIKFYRDEQTNWVSALIFNTINSLIISMKLMILGYMVPSGNLMRQAIDSIAMSILCSRKDLDYFNKFKENKYSTNKAIGEVLKKYKKLGVNKDAINQLKTSIRHYHNFSHLSLWTLYWTISYSSPGVPYLGAATFDDHKISKYEYEITHKINLAETLTNIINGLSENLK